MKLLIVVDMQKDFIDGALGTKEAQAIVVPAAQKIACWGGDIICTRDTHDAGYLKTQEGRNLPVEHCIEGTEGWQIQPVIEMAARGKRAAILNKPSFGSKELPEYIEARYGDELESVELIGLCTDICVISNAMILKAFFPEVPVYVDPSCCAGVTPESHSNALAAMKACQISVVD
ncbi:MAG: cysteine hydrolase [Eubacteriaceae bacterium]|jgi:nicotinamidase-related amidase|nr:cysteine hydrolase [Eubacteriaceae bacterium]